MDEARQTPHASSVQNPISDPSSDRDLLTRFDSLGGTGHGYEFGLFQRRIGAAGETLLREADLNHGFLIKALETRFAGVGLAENTVVFNPPHSDEWWTKDSRYWMAMRSFIKVADVAEAEALPRLCDRLVRLRDKLILDLEHGTRMFVFRNLVRNLTDEELARLHAAVRSYGDATLFYVRYADATLPPGSVAVAAPGLLIGGMERFTFSHDNKPLGPVDDAWLTLCRQAWAARPRRTPAGTAAGLSAAALSQAAAGQAQQSPPWMAEMAPPMAAPERPAQPDPRQPPFAGGRRSTASARRIVLVGNCQVDAMTGLYRRFVACRTGDVLEVVPSYQDLTPERAAAIEQADLVVLQVLDLKPQADAAAMQGSAPRLFIPAVTAAFLWPFAGAPHPKNVRPPFMAAGPYGGEAGDSYLNRLLATAIPPEQAVEGYVNLDVRRRVNLDRLYELVMDRQRSRDEATGYRIADLIEQHFRDEPLFLSPYHPNQRIAVALATQFFQRLGAEPDDIARMQANTLVTPFPKDELPIHPAVARHFGLHYVTEQTRYRYMNEGSFSFREYALRYLRYEWNETLEEGLSLLRAGEDDKALERLRVALAQSPRAAAGHAAMGLLLGRQGQREAAETALRRAIGIEPEVGAYHASLGNLLRETGRLDEAEAALRAAVAADPTDRHFTLRLALLLKQRGMAAEARVVLQAAIDRDPYAASPHATLAELHEDAGAWTEAEAELRAATALEPDNAAWLRRLARVRVRLGWFDQAMESTRAALAADGDEAGFQAILADCRLRQTAAGSASAVRGRATG